MIDPAVKGTKAALEQHHLFPRGYLEETGIDDLKQINQIANFAAVEWPANIKIGKRPPADYVPPLDHKMTGEERDRMYGWHALPPLWWELPYHELLGATASADGRCHPSSLETINDRFRARDSSGAGLDC